MSEAVATHDLGRNAGAWQRVAAVYGLIAVAVAAYWPSFEALHASWVDTEALANTHGYLIAAISLWLIWRNRAELAARECRPCIPGAALTLLLSAAWLVSYRAGIQALHLLLVPPLIASAVLACFGWRALLAVAFPIVFFVFALPVWDSLSALLQAITSFAVSLMAGTIGLPAYVEGNFVHIPAGVFEVENGCSGVHYLVTGLALAALYGEIHRETWRTRAIWFVMMGLFALVSNWIRVFTIIVAGHLTDMQSFLITVDHYYFGWVLFGAIVAVFFRIASRWPVPQTAPDEPARPAAPGPLRAPRVGWTVAGASLIALPALVSVAAARAHAASEPAELSVRAPAGWEGPHEFAADWQPRYPFATASRAYSFVAADAQRVDVFAVWYREQSQSAELIGSGNSLYGAADGLQRQSAGIAPGGDWREDIVRDVRDVRDARYVIHYRYRIGDRTFVRPVLAQVWYGVSSMLRPSPSTLTAYRARCEPDCDAARRRLTAFSTNPTARSAL